MEEGRKPFLTFIDLKAFTTMDRMETQDTFDEMEVPNK